ncbi:glycosyltransferase [Schleiferiaceae bacterium]|nr:glycosyltransferase [Schleiferiaceae bacterium]
MSIKIRLLNYSDSLGGSEKLFEKISQVDSRFVLFVFRKTNSFVRDAFKLLSFIKSNHINYIVCSNIKLMPIGLFCRRLIFRPSTDYFNRNGKIKIFIYRVYLSLFGRFCYGVIFQSHYLEVKYGRYFKGKSIILSNPLLHVCQNYTLDETLENKYFSDICVVGRLDLNKRHSDILKSVSKLDISSDLKIVFLGDGKERKSLCVLADELNLNLEMFTVIESCEYIRYIRGARLCLLNSRVEGYPNVLSDYKEYSNSFLISRSSQAFDRESLGGHLYSIDVDNRRLASLIEGALQRPNNTDKKWEVLSIEEYADNLCSELL